MNFADQFPVLDNCTYLNTANSGILSKSLYEWRCEHDLEFLSKGSLFRLKQDELLKEVKTCLAGFFNGQAANIYLVPNFSFGFNTFLEGLGKSERFLLLEEDYPSINYPVESRGFEHAYAPIDENMEDHIADAIKTFSPTVFAFSVVQYISGIKMDLNFIKELKALYPELLIVADGTQFCGTSVFDFENSGIDVLITSDYKWMLAGYGNGFVMLKDAAAERLYAHAKQSPLPDAPFLKGKGTLSLYFEPGHQDTLVFGGLKQSLLYLTEVGQQFIEDSVKQLSQIGKAAFAERGLIDHAVVHRKEHSSIFNLNIDGGLHQKLQEANIITSARGKGIRVSFHFYNNPNDLGKLLEVIDKNR